MKLTGNESLQDYCNPLTTRVSLKNLTDPLYRAAKVSRAASGDPVGGEDSFLKNLTDLSYYPDPKAMEHDLRVCQIM